VICEKCGSSGCEVRALFIHNYIHCPRCDAPSSPQTVQTTTVGEDGWSPNGWKEIPPDIGDRHQDPYPGIGWKFVTGSKRWSHQIHLFVHRTGKFMKFHEKPLHDENTFVVYENIYDLKNCFPSINNVGTTYRSVDPPEDFDIEVRT